MNPDRMIDLVKRSLRLAAEGKSGLPQEVLDLHGLNTAPYRHMLNILGAHCITYLEAGVYTGTTLLAACYDNPIKRAVAVDSWRSQAIFERSATYKKSKGKKPGPLQHFEAALTVFEKVLPPVHTIDGESFADETLRLVAKRAPFELYHYDADHSYESQRKALAEYAQFLAHPAIVVIHDWGLREDSVLHDGKDWTEDVRQGTEAGLQDIEYTNQELYREISYTPSGKAEGLVLVLG